MTTDKTREFMMPKVTNCEVISCVSCDTEAVILQKDYIVSYTCSVCYSVPRLGK